jgi:hypothetical protein
VYATRASAGYKKKSAVDCLCFSTTLPVVKAHQEWPEKWSVRFDFSVDLLAPLPETLSVADFSVGGGFGTRAEAR